MGFIPTKNTLWILTGSIALSALPIFMGTRGLGIWLAFLMVFVALLVLTPLWMGKFRKMEITLSHPSCFYTGEEDPISLTIQSPFGFAILARVRLEIEGPLGWEGRGHPLKLQPGENIYLFGATPKRRGNIFFEKVVVRLEAPFGLWEVERKFVLEQVAEALPNLRGVGRFALQFHSTPESQSGLKIERFRGEGSEFESLREYQPGFDIRSIDWKVSARKGKMVCREFRAEKNNNIILALDAGHLMASEFQGLTKLDYAINSLLVIAYMAVKSGDRVGFLAFDAKIRSYMAPQGKESVIQQISKECAYLDYQFLPTNFVVAMEYLMAHQKRRALVILFTDFVDVVSAEIMREYLAILSQRHMVVFVSIRDPYLDTYLDTPPAELMDMHKQVACYEMRRERLVLFQELQRMGICTLDLFPTHISVPVLNEYFNLRRRERI